jgi:hypothetical protein
MYGFRFRVYNDSGASHKAPCELASWNDTVENMKGSSDCESQATPQRKICHAAAVLILLDLSTIGSLGQTSIANTVTPPLYNPGSITDYRAALPNSTLTFCVSNEANAITFPIHPCWNWETTAKRPFGICLKRIFRKIPCRLMPAMPSSWGRSMRGKRIYLTIDGTSILNSKLKLQDIIKISNGPYLRAAGSIDIQRKGGAVRLPSGKVPERPWLIRCRMSEIDTYFF